MTIPPDAALTEQEGRALRTSERFTRSRDEDQLKEHVPQDRGQRLRRASAGLDELLRRS